MHHLRTIPRFPVLFLFAALLGGAGLLATRPYGLAVSTDAVDYLFTGSNLAAGRGFVSYDLRPYALWPPLYPLLLAAIQLAGGLERLPAATLLHGLTLLALAAGLACWMLRLFPGGWLWPLLGISLVELAPVTLSISQSVCSDYLFLLLCVLFFLDAGDYLRCAGIADPGRGRQWSYGRLLLWGMLAALQRYIGVALILAAALVVLLGPGPGRKRLGLAALLGVGGLPLLAWVARNAALGQGSFGLRGLVDVSAWALLAGLGRLLAGWFVVDSPHAWLRLLSWASALLGAGLLLAGAGLSWRRWVGPAGGRARVRQVLAHPSLAPLLIFTLVYAGLVLFSLSSVQVNTLQERFLAPLLLPIAAALLLALAQLQAAGQEWWSGQPAAAGECLQAGPAGRIAKRLSTRLLALVPLGWLAVMALRSAPLLLDFQSTSLAYGNLYNTPAWHAKPILQFLQAHPPQAPAVLFSNIPAGVAFHTGRPVLPSPRYYTAVQANGDYDLARYASAFDLPGQVMYLVWIEPNDYRHVFLPLHLRRIASLAKLAEFADGSAYYQITPLP